MPTQKIFKQRVRARMTKTGESYTSARQQLLRRGSGEVPPMSDAAPVEPGDRTDATAETATESGFDETSAKASAVETLTSDEAMLRGTGRRHAEWFGLLDEWQAHDHRHADIARWLRDTHGVAGWWAQNVTVAYERARGIRGVGQMASGYEVSVTRTVAADPAVVLAAFTEPAQRSAWLSDADLAPRPTRAHGTARFDWSHPPSRVVVTVSAKADGRALVAVTHERLPDAAAADQLRASWRSWLGALKDILER